MTNKRTKEEDRKLRDKIQKMLALAATNDNPNEAASAMRQAMNLMQRNGICETDLGGETNFHTEEFVSGYNRLPPWCFDLLHGISRALGTYSVTWNGSFGGKARAQISGERGATERALYIYVTAYRTIEKMGREYREDYPHAKVTETNDYKRGLTISYVNRVKEVYGDLEAELADEMGNALVPVDNRRTSAQEWFEEDPGNKATDGGSALRRSGSLYEGIRDGRSVSVTQGVKSNTHKTLEIGGSK